MFIVPEKFRLKLPMDHTHYSSPGSKYGAFTIPVTKDIILFCIATDGGKETEWEHVSVSVKRFARKKGKLHDLHRCPTWDEMEVIKSLFWEAEDTVVQFFPPESQYISHHHYCLHLWRKKGENFETPPTELIGFNKKMKKEVSTEETK